MSVICDRPVLSRALIVVLSAALMLAAAMTYSVSSFSGGDGAPAVEAEASHNSGTYREHANHAHSHIFTYVGARWYMKYTGGWCDNTYCYYSYDHYKWYGFWSYDHSSTFTYLPPPLPPLD